MKTVRARGFWEKFDEVPPMASESWIAILIMDGYIRWIDKLLLWPNNCQWNQDSLLTILSNNKYFIFILSDIANK